MSAYNPIIANVEITTDTEGRFNLNALHHASGQSGHKAPNKWLRTQQAKELIAELEKQTPDLASGVIHVANGGKSPGTFAREELAVSYAGWISPKFQLEVNRTFIAYRTGERTTQVKAHTRRIPAPDTALTPRQLLQQQLEAHASAMFDLLEDSVPVGLDRLEHVWLHNKNGRLTIGSTIFPHGEWRHGDLSAVLTTDYRWAIRDGKRPVLQNTPKAIETRKRGKPRGQSIQQSPEAGE